MDSRYSPAGEFWNDILSAFEIMDDFIPACRLEGDIFVGAALCFYQFLIPNPKFPITNYQFLFHLSRLTFHIANTFPK